MSRQRSGDPDMPATSTTRRQGRIRRIGDKIIEIYNSGKPDFSAADISKACELRSSRSACQTIAIIRPEDIGGITFEPMQHGGYRFTGGPEIVVRQSKGALHVLQFITDEWQPVTTIAAFANRTGRRTRTLLKTLEKSGAIESMYDEFLGVRYWRLKREATFHRASEGMRA